MITLARSEPLSTNQKLGGKGGSAADVNRLSVLATTPSPQEVAMHASPQKFCTGNILQTVVWAIFNHSIVISEIDLKEQHKYYLQRTTSWCQYVLDEHNYSSEYIDEYRLLEVLRDELHLILVRFSTDDLLDIA